MSITDKDRKILWGRSASRCAICKEHVVIDETELDDNSVVGEECHIIARKSRGPRGLEENDGEIDSYANLLILCRTHHKQVDDQPGDFTPEKLRKIKQSHEEWVADRTRSDEPTLHPTLASAPQSKEAAVEQEFLPATWTSDDIFSTRLADAFPGTRGLAEIADPSAALNRLDVLLREPLGQRHFGENGSFVNYPIWWFRGSRNMYITEYRRLGVEKCLIDADELLIKRVVAIRPYLAPSMWDFLYVESRAEPPVGIYEYDEGYIATFASQEHRPFLDEEYGLWEGRALTRAEYDDGGTVVDGKPIPAHGAELRVRYLTHYNFIICGNRHVINETVVDRAIEELMDGILLGSKTVEQLARFVTQLKKPIRFAIDDWS